MKQSTTQYNSPVGAPDHPKDWDQNVRAFLVAVGLLTVSAFGSLAVIEGFRTLQPAMGLGDSFAVTFLLGGSLATLWMLVVGSVYFRFRPVTVDYGLGWPTRRDVAWVIGGVVAIVLASLLVEVLGSVLGGGTATNISNAAAVANPVVIYTVFIVANLVFIAPVEEFFFRGVVQGRLRESFGPLAAISVTSIGFALMHIPSYWFGGSDLLSVGVWTAILSIGTTGYLFGAIYERTRSLLLVSIVHGLVNTIGIAIALVAFL